MAKKMKAAMKKAGMKKSAMKKSGMKKKSAMKSGMKKKNQFFTLMLAAKNKGAPTFLYNGKTYKRKQKGHLVYYKA
jgi:protein-disulfide isomerase